MTEDHTGLMKEALFFLSDNPGTNDTNLEKYLTGSSLIGQVFHPVIDGEKTLSLIKDLLNKEDIYPDDSFLHDDLLCTLYWKNLLCWKEDASGNRYLTCNEIIRGLNITDRLIRQEDLDRAFHSREIVDELTIHPLLEETESNSEETDHANRLDRIIIYAGINHDRFSEDQALDFLKQAGIQPDLQQIQNSLKRLELAFILGRKREEYFFRVPLFVHYHRTRNIAKLLEWEIQRYSGK